MIKRLIINLLTNVCCTLFLAASPALAQSSHASPPSRMSGVLPLIEKYKAPPFPKSSYIDRETYDYRIQSRRPVPPSLTDVFVCDIWQRVTRELKLTITPHDVSEEVVKQAMNVYLEKDWSDIAGYRPWTHWNFIRSLKAPQRNELAKEIAAYINKYGVRDREDATEQK